MPIRGVFREVEGAGTVTADGQVTGHLAVKTASLDTKIGKRDEHLRLDDFFASGTYPAITFTLAKVDGLRRYLAWCAGRGLDPPRRPHLELYIQWGQGVRHFKPSTVSRRFSVVAGFYRSCVIGRLLEYSPAGHMRRPTVPAESPTGFTHRRFEALHVTARQSPKACDFALAAMRGLLGLRILAATSAGIPRCAWRPVGPARSFS